jgi:hypothetical protein
MIEWASSHDFWSGVILSPEKFRKHFDTMAAQRDRDGRVPNPVAEETQRTKAHKAQSEDWEREIVRRREVSTPMPAGFKNVLKGRT